ncbi:ABC transporter substrate-binding protein [Tyzzerella sp. OttesenSCG-928-J15]|nr:ABC transporter substrate-binding protein [Tyzzerella sp. OttesenSCG-928-J15]
MKKRSFSSALAFVMAMIMMFTAMPLNYVYAEASFEKIVLTIDKEEITVDGKVQKLDPSNSGTTPVIIEGRTMLPVSCIGDIIGVKTEWKAAEKKVIITYESKKIELTIGSKTAVVNGKNEMMDVAPIVVNGRTMLPISAVGKFLGLEIEWNAGKREVSITKGASDKVSAVAESAGKVTLTDQAGRTVTFNANPKVASCYYISTLISLVIGGEGNLVGIENQNSHQPIYESFGNIGNLPQVGSGKGINYEELATTGAEVIIIPKRLQESIPQLEQIGVQAVVVVPETLDGLLECFEILGKVYGQEAKASEVISYYNNKIKEIGEYTKLRSSNAPKVYFAGNSSFLNAGTGAMYQNTIIELAGGVNVARDLTSGSWSQISVEQLQLYEPEIIFVSNGANYTVEELYTDVRLKGIPAIENKQVYAFPSTKDAWDVPSASSILGIMWAANKINGSVYAESKMAAEVEAFYTTFYKTNVKYTDVIGK